MPVPALGAVKTSAGSTSFTRILKLTSAERFGLPPSLTRTSTSTVPGPSAGVQVNRPVDASRVAPAGPLSSVQVLPGPSGSVAVSCTCSLLPSLTCWSGTGAMTGGSFTFSTFRLNVAVADVLALPAVPSGSPPSLTRHVKLSAPM